MFDFYDDADRKTELSRKLVQEMLDAGLDYSQTYKVMHGQADFSFVNAEEFKEYMRLEEELEIAKREFPKSGKLTADLPDFDRDTAVNGVE